MKKFAKTGSAIRPPRSPVLPIRVPQPVYDALKKEAKAAGMTLSEYANRVIGHGREMLEAIDHRRNLFREAKAECERIVNGTLEAELRRRNWKRDERGRWTSPEVHGLPPNGFGPGTAAEWTAVVERVVEAKLKQRRSK